MNSQTKSASGASATNFYPGANDPDRRRLVFKRGLSSPLRLSASGIAILAVLAFCLAVWAWIIISSWSYIVEALL